MSNIICTPCYFDCINENYLYAWKGNILFLSNGKAKHFTGNSTINEWNFTNFDFNNQLKNTFLHGETQELDFMWESNDDWYFSSGNNEVVQVSKNKDFPYTLWTANLLLEKNIWNSEKSSWENEISPYFLNALNTEFESFEEYCPVQWDKLLKEKGYIKSIYDDNVTYKLFDYIIQINKIDEKFIAFFSMMDSFSTFYFLIKGNFCTSKNAALENLMNKSIGPANIKIKVFLGFN